jgi:hypothetical protein
MGTEVQVDSSAAPMLRVCILSAVVLTLCLYVTPSLAQLDDLGGSASSYESNRGSYEPSTLLGPGEKPPPMEPVPGPRGMYGAFTESQSTGSTFYFSPRPLAGEPTAESRTPPELPGTTPEVGPFETPSQSREHEDSYEREDGPAGLGEP